MSRRARTASVLLALALLGVCVRRAQACAGCSVGDATLTVAGAEQPFAGRLRSAAELRYRSDSIGTPGLDQVRLRELRASLSLAWAPRQDLFLTAEVPWLYRRVLEANLARSESSSLGELELGAEWFFFRDRPLASRWLLASSGGLKFPTSPRLEGAQGQALVLEAQPGSGSLDLRLGSSVAYFQAPLSGYLNLQLREPLWRQPWLEPGRTLHGDAALQLQLFEPLAARAVSELLWAQPSSERGVRDPHSGGWVAFLGGELLLSVLLDASIVAGARAAVLNRLHGAHSEGLSVNLGFVRDW
jgi:hypothetical protein